MYILFYWMCIPFEVQLAFDFVNACSYVVIVEAMVLQFLVCFNSYLLTCSYLHMTSSLPYLSMSILQLNSLSSMVA